MGQADSQRKRSAQRDNQEMEKCGINYKSYVYFKFFASCGSGVSG
jgi:hypothetical protein